MNDALMTLLIITNHLITFLQENLDSCLNSRQPLFLLQRNEVGNSSGMEYEGFCRSMEYLLGLGLVIKTFVSDRHLAIAKHMKEKLTHITHYFDIWHLKKSMLLCFIIAHLYMANNIYIDITIVF